MVLLFFIGEEACSEKNVAGDCKQDEIMEQVSSVWSDLSNIYRKAPSSDPILWYDV